MKNPYLEWMDNQRKVQQTEIIDRIFIGRICQGIAAQKRIIIASPSASRDHAVIDRTARHLRITDTSKNGTWVNGVRMTAGSVQDLADGDVIRVGEFSFRVCYPEHVSAGSGQASQTEMTIVTPSEMVVTNLIADVRKFTSFFQNHASSDVFDVMKEIFDDFSAIVTEFKGTIKDYAGDAVYAFWEHQVESPQKQAALACQAAVRQMRHLGRLMAKIAERHSGFDTIQMGWGISTGSVTISHYGSRLADMALVGECINLASRLCDMANKELPAQIILCSQTAALVRNDLTLKELGEVTIRGFQGKERVFTIA